MNDELRWLGQTLGQARNFDVFATELVPAARARMPDEGGWEELAATLDGCAERHTTASGMRFSQSAIPPRCCICCGGSRRAAGSNPLRRPLRSAISRRPCLDRRRRKVRQRSKGFGRLNPRERHKLRIAAKKLRYTIELFGDLFPKRGLQNYTRKLKRLQDDLGYANDVRVAHDFLSELFSQVDPRGAAAHAWIGVLEWHDQRSQPANESCAGACVG